MLENQICDSLEYFIIKETSLYYRCEQILLHAMDNDMQLIRLQHTILKVVSLVILVHT